MQSILTYGFEQLEWHIALLSFLIAFLISVKSGQYKDTHTPAIRVLFDNKSEEKNKEENNSGSK